MYNVLYGKSNLEKYIFILEVYWYNLIINI